MSSRLHSLSPWLR